MEQRGLMLDEATSNKVAMAVNGCPVPLLNPAGEVIAYCVPTATGAKLEAEHKEKAHLWPPEEIARLEAERKNDPRPDVPHEEVLRWVREQ